MQFDVPLAENAALDAILEASSDHTEAHKAQIRQFSRDGFLVIDLNLPDLSDVIGGIKNDLASLKEGRVQDAWDVSSSVNRLANLKIVTDTLDMLYGRKSFAFQTLNFPVGTQQRAHSDTIHFHAVPERFMAGVWIPLEPTDANNGPIFYYPGSHKLPCYTLSDIGISGSSVSPGDYSLYFKHYEPMVDKIIADYNLERKEAYLNTGQAFIWAANLLHGGSPIKEPGRTRHSQVTHYYFENCLYYTPLHSDPDIGKMYYREPVSISSRAKVGNVYCGKEFTPPQSEVEEATIVPKKNFLSRIFR